MRGGCIGLTARFVSRRREEKGREYLQIFVVHAMWSHFYECATGYAGKRGKEVLVVLPLISHPPLLEQKEWKQP
jgi:hypothetical protein